MKRLSFFFIFLLSISTYSCKSSKKATDSSTIGKPISGISASQLIDALRSQQLSFKYFESKMKASVNMDGKTQSAQVHLRIIKDEVIWARITKLGIEGARMRVTPDSIQFVNRLDRTFVDAPISALTELYSLPADFDMLEALLLGEAPTLGGRPSEVESSDNTYMIQLMQQQFRQYEYVTDHNFEIQNMNYYDPAQKTSIRVEQSDYKTLETGEKLPYFRDITIKQAESQAATLNFSTIRASFDKKSFAASLTIPSHYKPMDIGM